MKQLFLGARLIDGTGKPAREDVDLLVDGSRITDIQPRGKISSDEAKVIDVRGNSVMPGLIDVHVHICDFNPKLASQSFDSQVLYEMAIKGTCNARLILESGITTIRTLGTSGDIDFALRDAIEQGIIPGPRIIAAGRPICITGGHGHFMGIEVDGVEEIRKAVRGKIKSGANVIKLMVTGGILTPGGITGRPQMNQDEIAVAIEEAHRARIKVCGHAEGIQGMNDAIAADIDCIEHGNFKDNEEGLQMMVERDTFLVPTLMSYRLIAEGTGNYYTEEAKENAQRCLEYSRVGFKLALAAGVKMAMGSDLNENLDQGWQELLYMVENGMSPMQAIVAGTKNGAELLGLDKEIGTLEPGKRADLIVVDGNPLEDIADIGKVVLVMKNGKEAVE